MVQPSTPTTIAFVAVVLAICAALVFAVRRAAPDDEPAEVTRRWTFGTAVGVTAWLGLTALASASGVLEGGMPPRVMFFFVASNGLAVVLGVSRFGRRLADGLPLWMLVAFQAFRLPLELILHAWHEAGVLPIQMTFEGHNFDIVTGALAVIVGGVLYLARGARDRQLRVIAHGFNVVGFALLVTVAAIAVQSTPGPLRRYLTDPPVELAFHAPYGWIVPFCVAGALLGHIVLFRALWRRRGRAARNA